MNKLVESIKKAVLYNGGEDLLEKMATASELSSDSKVQSAKATIDTMRLGAVGVQKQNMIARRVLGASSITSSGDQIADIATSKKKSKGKRKAVSGQREG